MSIDLDTLAANIRNATDLEVLRDALNALEDACRPDVASGESPARVADLVDLADLPTFSDDEPEDTTDVFSWDDERRLVYAGSTSGRDYQGRPYGADEWWIGWRGVRVSVDMENNAEAWWDAARAADDCAGRDALADLLDGDDTDATLSGEEWREALRWASTLPGWDTGDERAPHPLSWERI